MNKMHISSFKKIYPAAIGAGLSLMPLVSSAQTLLVDISNLVDSILPIVKVLVAVVFVLAIAVFGWGIVKYITAAGDPTKVKEARGFLFWGIVGIFVLASIFGLVSYIQKQVGVTGGTGVIPFPTVPNP